MHDSDTRLYRHDVFVDYVNVKFRSKDIYKAAVVNIGAQHNP